MKNQETLETKHPKLLPTITEYQSDQVENLKIITNLESIEKEISSKLKLSEYNSKLIINLFFKSIINILLFEKKSISILKLGKFYLSSYIDRHDSRRTNILFKTYKKVKKELQND